jgi:hypothetical protein
MGRKNIVPDVVREACAIISSKCRERLEFFKKGRQYFLHLSGKAFIVTDPEEINGLVHDDIRERAADHLVLIKVRMLKADYFQSSGELARAGKWWRDLRNQVHGWLFHTHRRGGIAFEAV